MTSSPYLLSVIIALYNTKDFIIDCLDSLSHQLDDDIEVIIINDGSTDCSEEKVLDYIEEHSDKNIRVLTQENHGVAHAKNSGLDNARGKYVTFLDSDDLVSSQYIQILKPILLSDKYDLIDFEYKKFSTSPPEDQMVSPTKEIVYDIDSKGLTCLSPIFENSLWHLVTRVYKRDLIAGDRFENGRRYEDVIFTPFQYFKTHRIVHLDHALYFYRDNSQGITRNIKLSDIEDMQFAMAKMLNFVTQHSENMPLRQLAALMLANCFTEIKCMSKVVYGYYHYEPETRRIFRRAAEICLSSGNVPMKKICQMRYTWVDCCLSQLRLWLKKR
ncbi:Glycosyl transferase, group 2 family protein [Serratia rubidaea]|uniref:glycosyltransferase n=1 Tax=Serratia rubidaea TaxID=61652 RepID=UPI0007741BF9|nr:glycosyltransferase [Serratia rubidaea]AML56372.1 Glycosyl transferase, group 2 family protein [Serratia rubidaea]